MSITVSAPTGSPRDLQVVALNSSALAVTWKVRSLWLIVNLLWILAVVKKQQIKYFNRLQRVDGSLENSQINGYTVQYTERTTGKLQSIYIGNPDKLYIVIGYVIAQYIILSAAPTVLLIEYYLYHQRPRTLHRLCSTSAGLHNSSEQWFWPLVHSCLCYYTTSQ